MAPTVLCDHWWGRHQASVEGEGAEIKWGGRSVGGQSRYRSGPRGDVVPG